MAVKMWLDELQHVAYDAEDILDEFATEGLRLKIEAEHRSNSNQVWFLFSDFNPSTIFLNVEVASKIKEITKRLEHISKHRLDLGLRKNNIARNRPVNFWQRLPTTSLVNESFVYGRDKDKEQIIELLLNDEMNDSKVGIIPIVGTGGIGKTTLAQFVYNDHRVQRHFDTKGWVCVSEEFDVLNITKAILESVTRRLNDFKSLQPLQDSLKEELAGKRFLIVLDDVWIESFNSWDLLQVPFNAGLRGSRVIITTRNEHVASITRTVPSHHLQELSDEYCWLLFAQHAFAGIDREARESLEMIGRKIVTRCEGLPLAAKTIGGLLRSKPHINEWENILNSRIYDLPAHKSEILPSLLLSYSHLPTHLKRCFAYCAIFPKGYEFEKEKLVWLWMAEGFIKLPQGKRRIEEVGDEYFCDLLARSFFRQSNGNKSRFVMHNLINELAQFVAREICCSLENKMLGGKEHRISNKTRHMSYVCSVCDNLTRFEALYQAESLCTFLPLDLQYRVECCYITSKVPQDLLPKLRRLRVLSLSHYFVKDLPNSIGDMKHLRYLDFSQTEITRLPESTSTLHNLQTLLLSSCHHLIELPTDMGRLVNLRHIDISGTKLQKMPLNMRRLTSLQTLSNFVVGEECCSGIGELRNIELRGSLFISGLKNMVNVRDAIDANLKSKNHLDELVLEWSIDVYSPKNVGVETDVLDMSKPHKNLKMLTIKQYSGSQLSSWIGDPTFSNLFSLCLSCCKNCTSLPALGQLSSLEHLTIEGMEGVKVVGPEFYGCSSSFQPFKSLATLRFEDMLQWEEWSTIGMEEGKDFPRLHTLFIQRCPKLRGDLPKFLPSLETLEIHSCQELATLPRLPLVRKIVLEECNNLVVRKLAGLSSLSFLSIRKILDLQYLPEAVLQQSTALEAVEITDCDDLTSMSNEARLQTLVSLQSLLVENCEQFVSLLAEDRGLLLPPGLKYLKLSNCPNLEKLPSMLHCLTSLEKVSIHKCPRVQSFPIEGFPSMIRSLCWLQVTAFMDAKT